MRDERGFTLLEILVASLIAGAAFAVLWRGAVVGLTTVRAAAAYETATALARSHLTLLGRDVSIWPDDMQGRDEGYTWHIHVARETTANFGTRLVDLVHQTSALRPTLYAVTVAISWTSGGQSRALQLDAQRLSFSAPQSIVP